MKLRREKVKLKMTARNNSCVKLPLIKSKRPKTLSLTNAEIERHLV
jgi:hypothetical protein